LLRGTERPDQRAADGRYVPGKDFNVIVVSIDPSEGTDLAAAKKRSYVKRYGHPERPAAGTS
jgi:hypothetical protein